MTSRNRKLFRPTGRVGPCFSLKRSINKANHGSVVSALGVPIADALLIDGLYSQVPKFTSIVSPGAVVRNGALNLQSLTTSASALSGIRQAYAIAISHVNIFLVAVICISVPTACGMEWLNIKKVSEQHEEEKKSARPCDATSAEQQELHAGEKHTVEP